MPGSSDFVVFSLLSDSDFWPANKEARAAFDHLLSLGIASTEPTTMVMEYLPMRFDVRSN